MGGKVLSVFLTPCVFSSSTWKNRQGDSVANICHSHVEKEAKTMCMEEEMLKVPPWFPPSPSSHGLSRSWLPAFSMQASPWVCDVARVCSSPRWAAWWPKVYQSWLVFEGPLGGISYLSPSSFLCALPVYCTLSVVQYMQLHVLKKSLK